MVNPRWPDNQPQKNTATTVGVWVLVAWFVGPAVLLALCCGGCWLFVLTREPY